MRGAHTNKDRRKAEYGKATMANARRPSGEARESAIIAAATAIYLESGYAGAKMSEIAKRAGIAEGTLYLYFRNKHALMRYHLTSMIEKWKLIELGFSIRYQPGIKVGDDLDFKRAYTAVFDELIENGLAVGHIEPGTEIPFMRDQFYGTLEYAARTIMLHGARKPDMDLAIEQLMHTFKRSYAATEIMPAADQVTSLSERLETAIARLEALAGPGEDGA